MKQPDLTDIFPLPQEAKKLDVFVGEWTVEGYLTFTGKRLKAKGIWMLTWAAAKWGILNIGEIEIEELGVYEEVDILSFDANENVYHLFSVTNTAATHDHKGNWQDEKTLRFYFEGVQEGKSYREDIEIKIISSNQPLIAERDLLDSQTVSEMEITLKKQSATKRFELVSKI